MEIKNIKTPQDILTFMTENIEYGWLDYKKEKHIKTMKNFRKEYRTQSIEETLKYKIGCCIDQVYLMHFLLNKLNIKNKMFCCRIYESDDYNDLDMIKHAGIGVAMGNAEKVVKESANFVTDTNMNEGVAKYLKEHILPK